MSQVPSPLLVDYSGAANRLTQLGQSIGQNRKQNLLSEYLPKAMGGDQNALTAVYKADPNAGLQAQGHIARQAAAQKAEERTLTAERKAAVRQALVDAAGMIVNMPEDQLPEVWPQIRAGLVQDNPELAASLPEPFSPAVLATAKGIAGIKPQQQKPQGFMNVSPGGAVFDPNSQKEVYRAPFKPTQYAPSYKPTTRTLPDGTVVDGVIDARSGRFIRQGEAYRPQPKRGPVSPTMVRNMNDARESLRASESMIRNLAEAKSIVSGKAYGENGENVGKLKAGPLSQAENWVGNKYGATSDNAKRLTALKQKREKLRSDYLMLAKGVQTEGDAQRAMNAMMPDTNDPDVMLQQLETLERATMDIVEMQRESLAFYEQQIGSQAQQSGGIPDGITPEEWNAMTAEERGLWQ